MMGSAVRTVRVALVALIALLPGMLGVVPHAAAANTYLTNPLGFAYAVGSDDEASARYGRPTGMVITGKCNRYAPGFATARANGAEILAYLNTIDRPDSQVCSADTAFYGGDLSTTPLWPHPTYGQRVNWAGTHMTDIRVGSSWANSVVAYVENLMREDKVDGVFLDVVGARLWSALANWDSWPQSEKDEYTRGTVDLVRRLDARRRAINPRFIIVNNNIWQGNGTLGRAGEPYVDGVCLEHHPATSAFHRNEAGRTFGNLGHRRVLIIAESTADAQAWADVQGVTHVSDQQRYGVPSPPPVGFNRLTDRPKQFGRTSIATSSSAGMAAHRQRGSKFELNEKATLLRFAAYLDGAGGVAGTQSVRMALYRDNAGLPGALVAQSPVATIAAGSTGRWVSFSAPPTALVPGAYWITIHTGDTQGVARNRGDGAGNWYSSVDQFADGPANPFGTGWAGNGTLSVNVSYTVG